MKKMLEEFKEFYKLQEEVRGYVRYVIDRKKDDWYIECYTQSGLFIRNKIVPTSRDNVLLWVKLYTETLREEREKDGS